MTKTTIRPRPHGRAFSLIELVIVVIIMGTISAIAIPRLVRGSDNADVTALKANFAILNRALDSYAFEHGGTYPVLARIEDQLTRYTDATGSTIRAAPDEASGVIYGPYVLKIPAVTYGPHTGERRIGGTNAPGVGWLYLVGRKLIVPNLRDAADQLPVDFDERTGWRDFNDTDGAALPEDL